MLGSPENKLVRLDECRQWVRDEGCHFDNHICALLGNGSENNVRHTGRRTATPQQKNLKYEKKERQSEHELLRTCTHQTVIAVAKGSEGNKSDNENDKDNGWYPKDSIEIE